MSECDCADGLLVIDPENDNDAFGGAVYFFTPPANDTQRVGLFVWPTIGNFTEGSFWSAYNMKWGNGQYGQPFFDPVPAGKAVAAIGYDANITTAQTHEDTHPFGGAHAFGATIDLSGGAEAQGVAVTANINEVDSNYTGMQSNIVRNVDDGGYVSHIVLNNSGTKDVDAGIVFNSTGGGYKTAIQLGGFPVTGAGYVGFKGGAYGIHGGYTDALKINGGGTSNALQLFAGAKAGAKGPVKVYDNPEDSIESLSINTANGDVTARGVVTARGYASRRGSGGQLSGNQFNIYWNGSDAELWIDNVRIGKIRIVP